MAREAGGAGTSGRSYQDALDALGTLISSNKRSHGTSWEACYNAMHTFLQRLELEEPLKRLKVVHVAGTKGKGSTCSMVESMLRAAGYRTGLYTSPHLCDVRERIRINGRPVEQAVFLRHFWDCFLTFQRHSTEAAGMPAYFRFLTLLGFKTFIAEGVDVAVVEVGLGGRLDATNIIPAPVVCGIASLGYDHMELLGHTLREIAGEKAGIFKTGVPALTVPQPEEAMAALEAKAQAKGVQLSLARPLSSYSTPAGGRPAVGLAGSHQEVNAALAVALTAAFEAAQPAESARRRAAEAAAGKLPEPYALGLAAASWPGRCQVVPDPAAEDPARPQLTFFLDGAHTPESMAACAEWFAGASDTTAATAAAASGPRPAGDVGSDALLSASPGADAAAAAAAPAAATNGHSNGGSRSAEERGQEPQNLLLFNCMQEREPERLLQAMLAVLQQRDTRIHHALFVPPDSNYAKPVSSGEEAGRDLAWQAQLRDTWEQLVPPLAGARAQAHPMPKLPVLASLPGQQDSRRGAVMPGLRTTLTWLRSAAKQNAGLRIRVLVTGSLYLVGDVLRQLGQEL